MGKHYLTDEDVAKFNRMWHYFSRSGLLNEGRDWNRPDIPQAPDVYVAKVPAGGIPARNDADPLSPVPGKAECEIWEIQEPYSANCKLVKSGNDTHWVFNVSDTALTEGKFIGIKRTKNGVWLADNLGGSGGVSCEWFEELTGFDPAVKQSLIHVEEAEVGAEVCPEWVDIEECVEDTDVEGIVSLNGLTGDAQTFAVSNDTNITLGISSAGTTHTFTPGWSGTLDEARGGTGHSSYTAGDILYASDVAVLGKLAIGNEGEALMVSGGLPTWGTPTGLPAAGNSGNILVDDGSAFVSVMMTGDAIIDGSGVVSIGLGGDLSGSPSSAQVISVQAGAIDGYTVGGDVTGTISSMTVTASLGGDLSGTLGSATVTQINGNAIGGNVGGARDDPESALANLLAYLSSIGLINDTTTAS